MLSKLGTLAGCLLCLRLVTAQISSVTSSSSVTSLQGSSGTTQSWSVEGRNNPLAFFLALGSMAPEVTASLYRRVIYVSPSSPYRIFIAFGPVAGPKTVFERHWSSAAAGARAGERALQLAASSWKTYTSSQT